MAVVMAESRGRAEQPRLPWREQPEPRSPDMAPPRPPRPRPAPARAAVVYYLARNSHLEHPHFMELALSSPDGLYLRDVIDRLDALRGKGMARMYSWASKRSYRNGFVWHDLADDDYIHPVAGREYVLKGTERLHPIQLPLLDAAASSCSSGSQDTVTSSSSGWENGSAAPASQRKATRACGRGEVGEYRVYKAEERAAPAADAATQTDDGGRGRGHQRSGHAAAATQEELSREETSPPTASTSPETLEALIKADGRVVAAVPSGGGRARASSVLMQLISCGSVSVKGALASPALPRTAAHYRLRPPRPPAPAAVAAADAIPAYRQDVGEDKEYFSGSIVETKRSLADAPQDLAVLRRSSSYNADRVTTKVEVAKEAVDLHDRCIPRKPKSKKEGYLVISGGEHGSKRLGG